MSKRRVLPLPWDLLSALAGTRKLDTPQPAAVEPAAEREPEPPPSSEEVSDPANSPGTPLCKLVFTLPGSE